MMPISLTAKQRILAMLNEAAHELRASKADYIAANNALVDADVRVRDALARLKTELLGDGPPPKRRPLTADRATGEVES